MCRISRVVAVALILTAPVFGHDYVWPSTYVWPAAPPPERPHLRVFTAFSGWCGFCNQMKPEIEKLRIAGWRVTSYPDMSGQIVLVNVDVYVDFTAAHNISSFPTLVKVEDGKIARKQAGYADMWGIGSFYKGRVCTPQNP